MKKLTIVLICAIVIACAIPMVSAQAPPFIDDPDVTNDCITGSGPDRIWGTADDIEIGGDGIPNTRDDWGPDEIPGTPDDPPVFVLSSGRRGTYRDDQGNIQTAEWDMKSAAKQVGEKWNYEWTLKNIGSGRVVRYTGPPTSPGSKFIVGPTVPGQLNGTAGPDRIPGTIDDCAAESETHERLQKGPPRRVRYSLGFNPDTDPGDILIPDDIGCCEHNGECSMISASECYDLGGFFSPGKYCSEDNECIPEFGTIAIPAVAVLGLLFLISRRRQKR